MYRMLKRCIGIFLLFAVTMSLIACDGNSSNKSRPDVVEISDLQMVLLCDIVYRDELDTYFLNGQEIPIDDAHSPIRDDYLKDMYDRNLPAELSGFTVVDFDHGDITGFRAAAFKKNNNIVVVYCGTEDTADVLADINGGLFDFSSQDEQAKQFAEDNANRYPGCNIYVAGYSLGGRLAYLGTETVIDRGYENRLMKVCTFNGLGVTEMINVSDSKLSNIHRLEEKMEDYIVNYIVKGDDVSDGWVKERMILLNLSHIGKCVYYDCTTPKDLGYFEIAGVKLLNLTKHDLYTFIDALSEHLKGSRSVLEPDPEENDISVSNSDFFLEGEWYVYSDTGFGNAQPGALIYFDEEGYCDLFSDADYYVYYYDGSGWVLECTNSYTGETEYIWIEIGDDIDIITLYRGNDYATLIWSDYLYEEDGANAESLEFDGKTIPPGTYWSTDGFGQSFTFYGDNQIEMNAFGFKGKGTYEINGDTIRITYVLDFLETINFGDASVWTQPFRWDNGDIFISNVKFLKE